MDLVLVLGALPKDNNRKELYEMIIELVKDKANKVSTPLDTMKFNEEGHSDSERYTRAMDLVSSASLIIGEHSQPSTGLGIEIHAAAQNNVPVVIIAKLGSKVSGMATGCPAVKEVIFYSSKEDLEEKLNNYFNK